MQPIPLQKCWICHLSFTFVTGADITSRDGIYSRFVTKLADLGFYGIKIRVDNNNGTAIILNENGAELPYSGAVAYVDPEELQSGGIPVIGRYHNF